VGADGAYGQDVWEALANKDPLWAACTSGKRRVDWRLDEFLASGEREVAWASHVAQLHRIFPTRRSLAIDFGCGPGRLTGALKERFRRVVGIDTSKTMLNIARRAHPNESVNFSESTKTLQNESVDLAYSTFVLQHLTQDEGRRLLQRIHPNPSPQRVANFPISREASLDRARGFPSTTDPIAYHHTTVHPALSGNDANVMDGAGEDGAACRGPMILQFFIIGLGRRTVQTGRIYGTSLESPKNNYRAI
jgi:SAM-dependent methyltransferase